MNTDTIQKSHSAVLLDRKRAELTGIAEVESFHEAEIYLLGAYGEISVEGENLKIDSFSVDSGKICISGKINGLFYYDKSNPGRKSIFARREK